MGKLLQNKNTEKLDTTWVSEGLDCSKFEVYGPDLQLDHGTFRKQKDLGNQLDLTFRLLRPRQRACWWQIQQLDSKPSLSNDIMPDTDVI